MTNNDQIRQPKIRLHVCRIQNQTPYRIGIQAQTPSPTTKDVHDCKYSLIIPPFSHKDIQVPESERPKFREKYDLAAWEDLGVIKVIHDPDELLRDDSNPWTVPLGYGVLVILIWLILAFPMALLKKEDPSASIFQGFYSLINIAVITIILFALTLFLARLAGHKEEVRKLLRSKLIRIGTWFQKSPYVLIVILIGWGMPAFALLSLNHELFLIKETTSLLNLTLFHQLQVKVFCGLSNRKLVTIRA